ncbi:MAG: hypothetical protein ACK6DA_00485 [Candidatus Kapaibacterium sp.]
MKNITQKKIAIIIMVTMVFQTIYPCIIYATSEKNEKNMMGTPLGTENMVDMFTGDFKYSIPVVEVPGPHGSGYTVNLNYNSSVTYDEEASWVGYGWSLSPGAITRQKRGIPDDVKDIEIEQWNKRPSIITTSATYRHNIPEFFDNRLSANGEVSLRYHTINGWSFIPGFALTFRITGWASLTSNLNSQGIGFNPNLNIYQAFASALSKDEASDKKNSQKSNEEQVKDYISTLEASWSNIGRYLLSRSTTIGTSLNASFSPRERDFALSAPPVISETKNIAFGVNSTEKGLQGNQDYTHIVSTTTSNYEYNVGDFNKEIVKGFGYLYSTEVPTILNDDSRIAMDYFVEKDKPFKANGPATASNLVTKGENNSTTLPIPYSNADIFMVSGTINGSFRAFHNKHLNFRLPKTKNKGYVSKIVKEEVLPKGGLPIPNFASTGFSAGFGYGENTMVSGEGKDFEYAGQDDTDKNQHIVDNPQFLFVGEKSASASGNIANANTQIQRMGRRATPAISITPITQNDLNKEGTHNLLEGLLFSQRHYPTPSRPTMSQSDMIYGFKLVDQNGMTNVYGYPLYSEREHDIRLSINNKNGGRHNTTLIGNRVSSNNFSFYDNNGNLRNEFQTVSIKKMNNRYATSFLLTELKTPDYVDVNHNGCDNQDLGGYTLFSYESRISPEKWRYPARGFFYSNGDIHNPEDDMVSVSYGKKKTANLKSIETKTHKAVFITNRSEYGSGQIRYDSYLPSNDESLAGIIAPASPSDRNFGKRLEKIELYELDDQGNTTKLLKTVHFAYDYSTQQSSNPANTPAGCSLGYGKLTLKRVWVESEGITEVEIPQYEFDYTSPTAPSGIHSAYSSFFPSSSGTNPPYNFSDIDPWGYYHEDGANRKNSLILGTNQQPSANFNPAVWKLQSIKLPGGSQIIVQYEQHTYRYVQDRAAMVLAKIYTYQNSKITIKPNDIPGFISSGSSLDELAAYLRKMFVTEGEQMYLKILANLSNTSSFLPPNLTGTYKCNYIPCYASVTNVEVQNNEIVITFSGNPWTDAIRDYQKAHNHIDGADWKDIATSIFTFANWIDTRNQIIIEEHSYIKIPILYDKKGGGVRVKRILTLNPEGSLEENINDATLYGTEYIYKIYDEISQKNVSSGVATNEPATIRDENPLVRLYDDNVISYKDQVVAGDNISQFEGPLGEELLPQPSIGYRQVIAKDINQGYSTGGYTIYSYNTVKEYPSIKVQKSHLNSNVKIPFFDINLALVNISTSSAEAYQDYTFTLNTMHGTPKSIHHYTSEFQEMSSLLPEGDKSPTSSVEYTYFNQGEPVPVLQSLDRPFVYKNLGYQSEFVSERRVIKESSRYGSLEGSLAFMTNLPLPNPPTPVVGFSPYYQTMDATVQTGVNCVVISHVPLLKSVKSMQDGIISETENIAFDEYTGSPLVIRQNDGYSGLENQHSSNHDGNYYTYTVPAYFYIKQLGAASINEGMKFRARENSASGTWRRDRVISLLETVQFVSNGSSGFNLNFIFNGAAGSSDQRTNQMNGFIDCMCEGDIIEIKKENSNGTLSTDPPIIVQIGVMAQTGNIVSCPVLPLTQNGSFTPPSTSPTPFAATVEVLKSGRLNRLNETSATFTLYGVSDKINQALEYSKSLAWRESITSTLNSWLDDGQAGQSLKYYMDLVFDPTPSFLGTGSPASSGTIIDPVYSDGVSPLIFNDNDNQLAFHLTKSENNVTMEVRDYETRYVDLPPSSIYRCPSVYGRTGSNPPNVVWSSRYMSIPQPRPTLEIWVSLNCNTMKSSQTYVPPSNPSESLRDDLPFTGGEVFGVNDDGEIVFYTYPARRNNTNSNMKWIPRGGIRARNTSGVVIEYSSGYYRKLSRVNALPSMGLNSNLNFVNVMMTQYKNNWNYDYSLENGHAVDYPSAPSPYPNDYITGRRIPRVYRTYTYKSDIVTGTSGPAARNYNNAGTFPIQFNFNNLSSTDDLSLSPAIIPMSTIDHYSADGIPISVTDKLDLPSASRLCYYGTLIACKGNNMRNIPSYADISYGSINANHQIDMYFQSFESTGIRVNNTPPMVTNQTFAHTGKNSALVNSEYTLATRIQTNVTKDYVIKFWAKNFNPLDHSVEITSGTPITVTSIASVPYTITPTGFNQTTTPWQLYEGVFQLHPNTGINQGLDVKFLKNQNALGYYIDDVVISPKESSIHCYVYGDENFKTIAEFNDNHFAKIVQYDMTGNPIRELIETTAGFKTVSEKVSNLYRTQRFVTNTMMPENPTPSMRKRNTNTGGAGFKGLMNPSGKTNNIDLLQFHLTPQGSNIEYFGDPKKLDSIVMKNQNIIPQIDAPQKIKEPIIDDVSAPETEDDMIETKFKEKKKEDIKKDIIKKVPKEIQIKSDKK